MTEDWESEMVVAVGSQNPAKLEAVHTVVAARYRRFRVVGVEAASGVSDQPRSDAETLRGAENRARASLLTSRDAMLGVGIESGVAELEGVWYTFTWVVVLSRDGSPGRGCSARLQLPDSVGEAVAAGIPLEEAMQRLLGATAGLGRAGGAMGHLTRGAVTRTQAAIQALHFAFAALPGQAETR